MGNNFPFEIRDERLATAPRFKSLDVIRCETMQKSNSIRTSDLDLSSIAHIKDGDTRVDRITCR